MLLTKILGILDIATALLFILYQNYGIIPVGLVCGFSVYLMIKGGLFSLSLDIASIIDLVCGIVIFVSIINELILPELVVTLIGIYLILKGFMSLLF